MQSSNQPGKISVPFANSGAKQPIPVASQVGIEDGRASYTDGFPPLTRTPLSAGGKPPFGTDMNGILNAITSVQQWQSAGGLFTYDSSLSESIGGYPKGAVLIRADLSGTWLNTVESNTTNPDTGGEGWQPEDAGLSAVAMSNANVTLTAPQAARHIIIITGSLTANLNLIFPGYQYQWLIVNNTSGAFTITCKTASGGGVVVASGSAQSVYGDGTSIIGVTAQQATEAALGSARIATQAQTNAGTDDATIITPKKLLFGFQVSLATTGYIKLPSWLGGLIVEWGIQNGSNSTLNFPLPFPTSCFYLGGTVSVDSNSSGANTEYQVAAFVVSSSQFRLRNGTANGLPIRWLALGY